MALIGALLTFRLPKAKLKGGALEQAVRNPAIPKMQFEMEDL